ncbi:response regulator transcription factor [Streptomyces sp. NEAU-YJ-81]|uniref:response regulator transcription factor n=1 Tax=Streptomyces sp. NEAU-YJ-81 TaxID=2820288 RepID=UPI001ABC08EF|nr:response regulator transcription factor [Streptomyces sp. NEAU-YJ-81]MBO3674886.1 response regulator transcription factor [Streptomyces sp. NEAU-YJ-81]
MRDESAEHGSGQPLQVAVVEDHEMTRRGLVAALNADPRLTVVSEVDSVEQLEVSGAEYDVCVADMMGVGTAEQFADLVRRSDVVVCTAAEQWRQRVAPWVCGAKAVFGKTVGAAVLANAVWDARHHPHWLKPHLASALETAVRECGLSVPPYFADLLGRTARGGRVAWILEELEVSEKRYGEDLRDFRRQCARAGLGQLTLLDALYMASSAPQAPAHEPVVFSSWAAGLSEGQIRALEWYADGYSYEETAAQLDVKVSTVRTQIDRAMTACGIISKPADVRMMFAMYVCSRHTKPDLLLRRLTALGAHPPRRGGAER